MRHESGRFVGVPAGERNPSVPVRQTEPRPSGSGLEAQSALQRYFITFSCYGAHLHGDESGSVDRRHNLPGSRLLDADSSRTAAERDLMNQSPYLLDEGRRDIVLRTLREVCAHRGWSLIAAHVRTTHVHIVVEAAVRPEKVMNDVKSYASRQLNRMDGTEPERKRWARHGSTRWLWKDQDVRDAVRYVVDEQGTPMAVHVAEGTEQTSKTTP